MYGAIFVLQTRSFAFLRCNVLCIADYCCWLSCPIETFKNVRLAPHRVHIADLTTMRFCCRLLYSAVSFLDGCCDSVDSYGYVCAPSFLCI